MNRRFNRLSWNARRPVAAERPDDRLVAEITNQEQAGATPFAEYWLFLREMARAPLRTAAVAPSSEALAALMASEVDPHRGFVVELGPGTGRLTEALLARGVPEDRLIVVEANPRFARLLARRFPRVQLRVGNAESLSQNPLPQASEVSAVVSGLPLPALGPQGQAAILRDWYAQLPKARGFYQFTYAPVCPVAPARLREWGLGARRLGSIVFNVPPAFVYRFTRLPHVVPAATHD